MSLSKEEFDAIYQHADLVLHGEEINDKIKYFETHFNDTSSKFGLKEDEFDFLDDEYKKKLIKLMARIMERAYRRGVQQTLCLLEKEAIDEWILQDIYNYRYEKSLDVSIGLDGYTTSSIERLFMEEHLGDLGFNEFDTEKK